MIDRLAYRLSLWAITTPWFICFARPQFDETVLAFAEYLNNNRPAR